MPALNNILRLKISLIILSLGLMIPNYGMDFFKKKPVPTSGGTSEDSADTARSSDSDSGSASVDKSGGGGDVRDTSEIIRRLAELKTLIAQLDARLGDVGVHVAGAADKHTHTVQGLGGHLQALHENLSGHSRVRDQLQQELDHIREELVILKAREVDRDRCSVKFGDTIDGELKHVIRLSPISRGKFDTLRERWATDFRNLNHDFEAERARRHALEITLERAQAIASAVDTNIVAADSGASARREFKVVARRAVSASRLGGTLASQQSARGDLMVGGAGGGGGSAVGSVVDLSGPVAAIENARPRQQRPFRPGGAGGAVTEDLLSSVSAGLASAVSSAATRASAGALRVGSPRAGVLALSADTAHVHHGPVIDESQMQLGKQYEVLGGHKCRETKIVDSRGLFGDSEQSKRQRAGLALGAAAAVVALDAALRRHGV